EDEALHLRVPPTGLVAEVDAALEQLPHGDDRRHDGPSSYVPAGTPSVGHAGSPHPRPDARDRFRRSLSGPRRDPTGGRANWPTAAGREQSTGPGHRGGRIDLIVPWRPGAPPVGPPAGHMPGPPRSVGFPVGGFPVGRVPADPAAAHRTAGTGARSGRGPRGTARRGPVPRQWIAPATRHSAPAGHAGGCSPGRGGGSAQYGSAPSIRPGGRT